MTHRSGLAVLALVLVACGNPPMDWEGLQVRRSACLGLPLDPLLASYVQLVDGLPYSGNASAIPPDCSHAPDCDALVECMGIDRARTCDPLDAGRCLDDRHLEQCTTEGLVQTVDCALSPSGNDRCVPTVSGGGHCAVAACEVGTAARCDGDAWLECTSSGVLERVDCAAFGLRCAEAESDAACVQTVEVCEASRCDGDDLLICNSGLGTIRQRCADRLGEGATCADTGSGVGCVVPTAVCEAGEARCEGDVARFCVDGVWQDFDCATFGGGACESRGEGSTGVRLGCRAQ